MRTLTVEREIFVPKNTAKDSPRRYEVPVGEGLVVQTRVTFPPGPAGYVGVRIRVGGMQVVPMRLTEWLIGDDITYTYSVPINLFASDGRVTVEAYNEDEVYDHTVILTFELIHAEKTPEELLADIVQDKVDLKMSEIRTTLETILSSLVELKGTVEQLLAEQREIPERQAQILFLQNLKGMSLEELTRI